MANEKTQALYNQLTKDGYDLGDYNTFSTKIAQPDKAKLLHDKIVSDGYDVGDFDTFFSKVAHVSGVTAPESKINPIAFTPEVQQGMNIGAGGSIMKDGNKITPKPRQSAIDSTMVGVPTVDIPNKQINYLQDKPQTTIITGGLNIPTLNQTEKIYPDPNTGIFTPEIAAGLRGEKSPNQTMPEKETSIKDWFGDLFEGMGGTASTLIGNTIDLADRIKPENLIREIVLRDVAGKEGFKAAEKLRKEDSVFADPKYLADLLIEKGKELSDKGYDSYGTVTEKQGDKVVTRPKDFTDLWKEGKYGSAVGNILLEGGKSLPTSIAAFTPVGMTVIGAGTFNEKYNQVSNQGMGVLPSILNAGGTAAFEVLTEKLGAAIEKGIFKKLAKETAEKSIKSLVVEFLKSQPKEMLTEGTEEAVNTFASGILDFATGATKDYATLEDVFKSFMYGAGGGLMGGATIGTTLTTMNASAMNKVKKQYQLADNNLTTTLITGGFNPQEVEEIKQTLISTEPKNRNKVIVALSQAIPNAITKEDGKIKFNPEIGKSFDDFFAASDNYQDVSSKYNNLVEAEKKKQDTESQRIVEEEKIKANEQILNASNVTTGEVQEIKLINGKVGKLNGGELKLKDDGTIDKIATGTVSFSEQTGFDEQGKPVYAEPVVIAPEHIEEFSQPKTIQQAQEEANQIIDETFIQQEVDNFYPKMPEVYEKDGVPYQINVDPNTGSLTMQEIEYSGQNVYPVNDPIAITDAEYAELSGKQLPESIKTIENTPENEVQPQGEAINLSETAPKTFKEQIPVNPVLDAKGKPTGKSTTMYEQAPVETTIGALNEQFEPEEVVQVVDAKIKKIESEIAKVGKVKITGDIDTDAANKAASKQALSTLNEQLDYWNEVKAGIEPKNEPVQQEPEIPMSDSNVDYYTTTAEKSTDIADIKNAYDMAMSESEIETLLPWQTELLSMKIHPESFNELGDRNYASDVRAWLLSKKTQRTPSNSIGTIAEELSNLGVEVTPDMIVEFILDHPYMRVEKGNEYTRALSRRFSEVASKMAKMPVGGLESKSGKLFLAAINSIKNKDVIFVEPTDAELNYVETIELEDDSFEAMLNAVDNIDVNDLTNFLESEYAKDRTTEETPGLVAQGQSEPETRTEEVNVVDQQIIDQQPNLNPSEAQKEAGNYKKAHVTIQGMDISVENPVGSVRRGTDEDGKAWEHVMKSHYGYFKNTTGKDGDHIDVFVGANPESVKVFVVDQVNPSTGAFDESKVMLGYDTAEQAKEAYLENYDKDWKGFSAITEVGVEDFKKWLYDGARQRKPFSEYVSTPEPIESLPKQTTSQTENSEKLSETETNATDNHTIEENKKAESFQKSESNIISNEEKASFQIIKNDNPLVALHNIDEDKLLNANKIGALPMPSIAITNIDNGFDSFGEITLIGNKRLIDPKNKENKIFAGDAYSPRYPNVTYNVKNSKAVEKFANKLPEQFARSAWHRIDQQIEDRGLKGLKDSGFVMYQFLKERGIDTTTERTSRYPKHIIEAISNIKGYDYLDIRNNEEAKKIVSDLYMEQNPIFSDMSKRSDFLKLKMIDENGMIDSNILRDFFNSVKQESRIKDTIDESKTLSEARKYIEENGLKSEFNNYAENLYDSFNVEERIFKGYTPSGSRRYVPHTLDNVMKEMKSKKVAGGEGTFYGAGSARALVSPQFKSIEQIKAKQDLIVSSKDFEAVKEDINNELYTVSELVKPFYKYSDHVTESMSEELTTLARNGQSESFNKLSPEAQQAVGEFLEKLRNLPTEYFEAKITRPVYLSEFTAAIVPMDASQKTIEMLENAGLKVERYDNNRAEVLKRLAEENNAAFQIKPEAFDAARTASEKYEAAVEITKGLDEQNNTETIVARDNEEFISMLPEEYADFLRTEDVGGVFYKGIVIVNSEKQSTGTDILLVYEHEYAHKSSRRIHSIKELADLWENATESDKLLLPEEYLDNPDWVKGDELISHAVEDIIEKQGYDNYKNGNIDLSSYSEILQDKLKKTIDHANQEYLRNIQRRNTGGSSLSNNNAGQTIGNIRETGNGRQTTEFGRENERTSGQSERDIQGAVPGRSEGILQGKILVDGIQRPTTNSNGKPIHSTEEGIRNFWRWFGDSKVTDEQGRPLVVYHGTKSEFYKFETDKQLIGWLGKGFYFTKDKSDAKNYGRKILNSYLKIENPFVIETDKINPDGSVSFAEDVPAQIKNAYKNFSAGNGDYSIILKENGHDGIIWGSMITTFSPTQIKSATGNDGSFDGEDASILNEPTQTLINFTPEEQKDETDKAYGSEEKQQEAIDKTIAEAEKLKIEGSTGLIANRRPEFNSPVLSKRTVLDEFKESGYVNFVGQKIHTHQDIADMWSIHRSPYIEKAHIIFVNDKNEIVGTIATTSNHASQAQVTSPSKIIEHSQKIGATGVYMLHNHPSGNPTQSSQDVKATFGYNDYLSEAGIELKGHLVLDHDKYTFIEPSKAKVSVEWREIYEGAPIYDKLVEQTVSQHEYKKEQPRLFTEREVIGQGYEALARLFEIGKNLLSEPTYKAAIIYLQSTPKEGFNIAAYDIVPEGVTKEDIVRIANEGLKNNLGASAVIAHDGSFGESGWRNLNNRVLDVINTKNESHYFSTVNYPVEKYELWVRQVLGVYGARNLDAAEEATTRLDNLRVAKEMEDAGIEKEDPRGGVYNSPEYKLADKVRKILKLRGIDKPFSVSDTDFGKSMYFTVYRESGDPLLKIRISDHSVSNIQRIFGEQHESSKSDPVRIANDIELAMYPERYNKIQTGVRYFSKYNNEWTTGTVENGKAWVKSYNDQATEKQLENLNPEKTRIVSKEFVKESKSGNKIYKVVLENLTEVGEVPTYRYDRKETAPELKPFTPQEIRLATGWEKGVDGLWRYEVPDGNFKNIKYSLSEVDDNKSKLEDIWEDKTLFEAYPELKDISIKIDNNSGFGGSYDKATNTITLNLLKSVGKEGQKSTLIHEIQHAIQDIEGFAKGGNEISALTATGNEIALKSVALNTVNKVAKNNGYNLSEEQKQKLAEQVYLWDNADDNKVSEIQKEIGLNDEQIADFFNKDAFELYRRLAGEVEARNASARMNMSEEERRQTLLSATADVAPEDQIVIMDNLGVSENRPIPPTFSQNTLIDERLKKMKEFNEKEQAWQKKELLKNAISVGEKITDVEKLNKSVNSLKSKLWEGWADLAKPVKKWQDYLQSQGVNISDNDNWYMRFTMVASKVENRFNEFKDKIEKPFLATLKEIEKKGFGYDDVTTYAKLKHADEYTAHIAEQKNITVTPDTDFAGKKAIEKRIGATADEYIKYFEDNVGTELVDKFWNQTHEITHYALNEEVRSGMRTKESADQIKSLFEYYIPMKGHREITAENLWDYSTEHGDYFFNVVKQGKGRKSESDDPFSVMESTVRSAIGQAEENIQNQALLRLAEKDKTGSTSISKTWFIKTGEEDGKAIFEIEPEVPFLDTDTQETYNAKIATHEAKMKALAEVGEAYQGKIPKLDIGVWIKPVNVREHEVVVKRNGENYTVRFNTSPRVPQAVNGVNMRHYDGLIGETFNAIGNATRAMAGFKTLWRPAFIFVTNPLRDIHAGINLAFIDEGATFTANVMKNLPLAAYTLGKRSIGKSDLSNKYDKMLNDYMVNGGKTGISKILELKQIEREIKDQLKNKPRPIQKVFNLYHTISDITENQFRLAVFFAAKEKGYSTLKATSMAKEATINFDRKGNGRNGLRELKSTYAFVNVAFQAIDNIWTKSTQNTATKRRALAAITANVLGGMLLVSILNSALSKLFGDDEDKWIEDFSKLSSFERNANFLIWTPNGIIKYPLGQEFRMYHGLGMDIMMYMHGKTTASETAINLLKGVSSLMPYNPIEAYAQGGIGSAMPDIVSPVGELIDNKDWMGSSIYKENQSEIKPGYLKVRTNKKGEPYAPESIILFAKALDHMTGGDEVKRGWLSPNPDIVDQLLGGYMAGIYQQPLSLSEALVKGDLASEFVPRAIWKSADDLRSRNTGLNEDFYDIKNQQENDKYLIKGYLESLELIESDFKGGKIDKSTYNSRKNEYENKIKSIENSDYYENEGKLKVIKDLEEQLPDKPKKQQDKIQSDINDIKQSVVDGSGDNTFNESIAKYEAKVKMLHDYKTKRLSGREKEPELEKLNNKLYDGIGRIPSTKSEIDQLLKSYKDNPTPDKEQKLIKLINKLP